MKSTLRFHVGSDRFVTGKTQLRLPPAIAAVVAGLAIFFQLGVRSREFSGHEQRLRICPVSVSREQQTEECHQRPCALTISSPHVPESLQ